MGEFLIEDLSQSHQKSRSGSRGFIVARDTRDTRATPAMPCPALPD